VEKYIDIPSYWGTARNEYITLGNSKLAVILPGQRYTGKAPLLYYPLSIALESGYDALAVEYGFQRGAAEFVTDKDSLIHIVNETKEAINICLEEKRYSEILFIGKSLGTLVQAYLKNEFKDYLQRHVFLTPLPECISVIKQTDCMVAAGTNDRAFKSEHLAEISGLKNVTLITIEGADHSMEKGNFEEDLRILTEVCGSIYAFIK
jgi:hypothetical protein